MERYWPKRNDFPREVIATDAPSSDKDSEGDDDDDERADAASSMYTPLSPVRPQDENQTPDVEYAQFRAKEAAQKSTFTGWQAELHAWGKSFSSKHKPNMDLCKYWAVRSLFVPLFLLLTLLSGACILISHYCTHCFGYPSGNGILCSIGTTLLFKWRNG